MFKRPNFHNAIFRKRLKSNFTGILGLSMSFFRNKDIIKNIFENLVISGHFQTFPQNDTNNAIFYQLKNTRDTNTIGILEKFPTILGLCQ